MISYKSDTDHTLITHRSLIDHSIINYKSDTDHTLIIYYFKQSIISNRAVLSELFKNSFDQNEAMLVGKLLHTLFQKVNCIQQCTSVPYVLTYLN